MKAKTCLMIEGQWLRLWLGSPAGKTSKQLQGKEPVYYLSWVVIGKKV